MAVVPYRILFRIAFVRRYCVDRYDNFEAALRRRAARRDDRALGGDAERDDRLDALVLQRLLQVSAINLSSKPWKNGSLSLGASSGQI